MIFNFLCCQPGATLWEVIQQKCAIINLQDFRRLFLYRGCCVTHRFPSLALLLLCGVNEILLCCWFGASAVPHCCASEDERTTQRNTPLPRQSRQAGEVKIICLRRVNYWQISHAPRMLYGPPNNPDAAGRCWCPCCPSPHRDPAIILLKNTAGKDVSAANTWLSSIWQYCLEM